MKQLSAAASLLAATLFVVGCGGSNKSPTPGQAQNVFAGTTSTGLTFQTIILPNDKFYGVYGSTNGDVLLIEGMIAGQGVSNNGKFTATVTDFVGKGEPLAGTIAATYVTGSSISGTFAETGSSNVTFTGAALSASSSFNYGTPALLSDIADQKWGGTLQDGTFAIVIINPDGTFSGRNSECSFSGTVTPDSSGKNFFNVSLTYGASPCLLPNQTQTGIAVDYLLSDGITRQLLAGVASGISNGTVFVANSSNKR